jgi:hypothetical protein
MNGQTRQEMVAALAIANHGDTGKALFQFMRTEEEGDLLRISKRYNKGTLDREAFRVRMDNLARFGRRLSLEDVHPGWILEHLRGESPRLLSLLSNFLSQTKSEYILSQLSFSEHREFAKPSREIHPELLDTIRFLIEKKLGGVSSFKSEGFFSFYHLSYLKGNDLQTLFCDLGIEGMAKAFSGVDSQVLRAILTRFPLREAREIRSRLKKEGGVNLGSRLEVQKHILSLSFGQVSPNKLLSEVGYSIFVKAVDLGKLDWAMLLCQKLPVADGYRLKRLLQEKRSRSNEGNDELKDDIMRRLFSLAVLGRVQRYWKEEREIEPTVIMRAEAV